MNSTANSTAQTAPAAAKNETKAAQKPAEVAQPPAADKEIQTKYKQMKQSVSGEADPPIYDFSLADFQDSKGDYVGDEYAQMQESVINDARSLDKILAQNGLA